MLVKINYNMFRVEKLNDVFHVLPSFKRES